MTPRRDCDQPVHDEPAPAIAHLVTRVGDAYSFDGYVCAGCSVGPPVGVEVVMLGSERLAEILEYVSPGSVLTTPDQTG